MSKMEWQKIRQIVDIGLSLLAHSHVPFHFWPLAFVITVFLINCMPSLNIDGQSPFEKFLVSNLIMVFCESLVARFIHC